MDMMTDFGFSTTDYNTFHDGNDACGFRGFEECSSYRDRSLSSFNETSSRFSDFDFDADHAGFSQRANSDYQCDYRRGFSYGEAFSHLEKFL